MDEVIPDAPWKLDEAFVRSRRIDYVAIDEGTSIDPSFEDHFSYRSHLVLLTLTDLRLVHARIV